VTSAKLHHLLEGEGLDDLLADLVVVEPPYDTASARHLQAGKAPPCRFALRVRSEEDEVTLIDLEKKLDHALMKPFASSRLSILPTRLKM
jgi:hypothetical protein